MTLLDLFIDINIVYKFELFKLIYSLENLFLVLFILLIVFLHFYFM